MTNTNKADLVTTPQPYYIPGYQGYCPQYKFKVGDTYGSQTHKLLLDPSIPHSGKLVLSDNTADFYNIGGPNKEALDVLNEREKKHNAVFKYPLVPGYNGFKPGAKNQLGQRFAVEAGEALAKFEKDQVRSRTKREQLEKEVALQSQKWDANTEEKQMVKSDFKLPLLEVRPEACGVLRNIPVKEPQAEPQAGGSPYFMEVLDPNKKFMPGYTGHVPFGYSKYGQGYAPYTNSALCDFTSNYRRRQSTEWAPVTISRPDPPLLIAPTEIYPKHMGMLPNYSGHIPGIHYRSGKTFGNASRDAKRWLRGDFTD